MTEENTFPTTIVAPATPTGESALAIIRLSGSLCMEIAMASFEVPDSWAPRTVQLGYYKNLLGEVLDQCVYIVYPDSRSYTGEAMLELHTHGNALIVQRILIDLIARGAVMAEPGEFTRRAFLNGKLDLTQAEAVADLIHAKSERALHIAQRQLSGSLGRKVSELTEKLLTLIANVEVYIDFPEEDLPEEEEAGPITQTTELIDELSGLIETRRYSELLGEGLRTVIVGVPNAGKSSLLNALLGHERALVSDEPGTTRDFISEKLTLGPYHLNIIDTAGLREDAGKLEARGIEKSLEKMQHADFFLWVLDSSQPLPVLPSAAANLLRPENTLIILNKIDLQHDAAYWEKALTGYTVYPVSLTAQTELNELRAALQKSLEQAAVVPSDPDALIVNTRHAAAFESAVEHLTQSRKMMIAKDPTELVASELRCVLDAFCTVVGKIDFERVLDKVFSSFCIGK
jgi:tRNA modification GTPase